MSFKVHVKDRNKPAVAAALGLVGLGLEVVPRGSGSLPASFPADPDSPLKSRRTPGPAEPIHPDQERCRNCTAPSLSFGLLGFSV